MKNTFKSIALLTFVFAALTFTACEKSDFHPKKGKKMHSKSHCQGKDKNNSTTTTQTPAPTTTVAVPQ